MKKMSGAGKGKRMPAGKMAKKGRSKELYSEAKTGGRREKDARSGDASKKKTSGFPKVKARGRGGE